MTASAAIFDHLFDDITGKTFSDRPLVEDSTYHTIRSNSSDAAASNGPDRRRNFDVEDIVGYCVYCRAPIYAEDPGTICVWCRRDDAREFSGE